MRFLLCLFLAMIGSSAFARDPATVIPTHTSGQYTTPGLFGPKPRYSENMIELLNYVDSEIEKSGNKQIDFNMIAYGISSGTVEDGFAIIAPFLTSTNLSGLTASDWSVLPPDSIVDALNRMSALLKTLNTNTAIP